MRFGFLLRPGWIGLILLVGVFSTICFTVLAPWQFSRHTETQARNEAVRASMRADPQPLSQVLERGSPPNESDEWTRVSFTGRYLPDGETLAWQRSVRGEPAFEVLTPFRLRNGQTLLVDRGFIRPVQSTRAPDYSAPPSGTVRLTARIRLNEHDSENRSLFRHDGHRWTYAINSNTVGEGVDIPLRSGYFTLVENQPGGLQPIPLPRLESGPYLSYAMQWIIFGIMAPLAVVYLIYSEVRTPRDGSGKTHEGKTAPRKKSRVSVSEAIAAEERQERENTG
ncbi:MULTISPECIES: SURF1 family cytochrome oxidase biogenesis protein [unclassified Actinopolyspora]|uniref:SURF1 family cytochrome oxidase biogenesis protein n=1 Tax=unclassified Actinopolyspora TaxID=2639451 RepID=UPI0013F5FC4F|nr:SURF1 family protein [Actinopolyspora sp. BKK2]NHE77470.1 SURF1 family protein [Actinopolyspora sp. BKK1]